MLSVLLKMGTLRVMLICVPPSVLPFLGNTSRMSVQWKTVSEVVQSAHIIWHIESTCLPYFCLSPFLLPDILPVICTTWMCAKFQTHYGMTYNIHTLHNLLHICIPKYGQVLTCMSLEGVWLQLVIQAKKILTRVICVMLCIDWTNCLRVTSQATIIQS